MYTLLNSVSISVHWRVEEDGERGRKGSTTDRKKIMTPNEEVSDDPEVGNFTTACIKSVEIYNFAW